VALRERVRTLGGLARAALQDLFDQKHPFGRLALVQVLMLAGDTLVTISLAGSLFFSISPTEAKSKVLLYLVLTIAPFAVVSPMLGPLIDRSQGARRIMVAIAALGRAALCPLMARDIHSLMLFPEAFGVLVLSKLYLVTRGALVPELAALEPSDGWAPVEEDQSETASHGFAGWNAQLTLLGTFAGFAASIPGVALLKGIGAPAVLWFDVLVFLGAGVAAFRLPSLRGRSSQGSADEEAWGEVERELVALSPVAHPEVIFALSANAILRGVTGFLMFMLAFDLRRMGASLFWFGLILVGSGVGALLGLAGVTRLARRMTEQLLLVLSLIMVSLGAVAAAYWGSLAGEVFLAAVIGAAGAIAQPSFDALIQAYVPQAGQGRAFAKFATRQQLIWVIGALIPVAFAIPIVPGDIAIAVISFSGMLAYVIGRVSMRGQALPTLFDPGLE